MARYNSRLIGIFQRKKTMTEEIIERVKKFSKLVQDTFSPRSKVILFGSYAKGKNTKWSDIDVAVILPRVGDRLELEIDLRIKSLQIDDRINPFVFSFKELEENSPLMWEIKKYGKKIA